MQENFFWISLFAKPSLMWHYHANTNVLKIGIDLRRNAPQRKRFEKDIFKKNVLGSY